ncbi:MAG: ribosome assembly cofactor RimP [Prevotellaceae bacterium]|jgi:ribosome maturation factor RimP|nr:ribosome assembly cofactor RimP [Prevotellaceae bacterium]
MINAQEIAQAVEQFIAGSDIFLVDVTVTPTNEIEVLVDKPAGLGIDECVNISRAVEAAFDREKEDFELTVGSPGLSEPLKVLPQYQKLLGKEVEILLKSGVKMVAKLLDASPEKMTVEYTKMELVEGKKRKQSVVHTQELQLGEVKWTKAFIKV